MSPNLIDDKKKLYFEQFYKLQSCLNIKFLKDQELVHFCKQRSRKFIFSNSHFDFIFLSSSLVVRISHLKLN
jgi:hypothetical protein